MAVIGPMRKLTIGNKTYLIAAGLDSLPIASASTLGGIKVGTGLTIDSTTGVLSATGTDVTIDNAVSGTSTNPVQNKVIKEYVDGLVAGVLHYKGTKATTAALPSSGNITGDVWHVTLDGGEYAWDGSTWQELGTVTDLSGYMASADYPDLTAIEGISATSGLLKKTAANTWTLDTSNYLTSFTETDPVYSASAAAGITSTDIANWNGKVSDDKTWNGVSLDKSLASMSNNSCRIPFTWDTNGETSARMMKANKTPTASNIALYDDNSYLNSTTPTAGDSSTKVATTAFVQGELPTKVSDLTNDSGFITSYVDEKVKQNALSVTDRNNYSLLIASNNSDSTSTGETYKRSQLYFNAYNSRLYVGSSSADRVGVGSSHINFYPSSGNYYTKIEASTPSAIRTITLPDKTGTVALTSDIPDTSSFLTTETDPVFSASPAAGITSTNITNWNNKANKNFWYGTCDTEAATQAKVITTTSNDFTLTTGNMIRIKFTNGQTYNGTTTINVDGTGAIDVVSIGTTAAPRFFYRAGEVVDFVYDGTNFTQLEGGHASTQYFGITKLSSALDSTSENLAATSYAVKQAYDLANSKQDLLTAGDGIDITSNVISVDSNLTVLGDTAYIQYTEPIDVTKQDVLVSGQNIKTINNQSILGSGNINTVTNLIDGSSTGSIRGIGTVILGTGYALGNYALAAGQGTVSQGRSQTTIGEYNTIDSSSNSSARGQYAFVVGNGIDTNTRSNAFTVDWQGNTQVKKTLTVGSNSNITGGLQVGALENDYGLNDLALLEEETKQKWNTILGNGALANLLAGDVGGRIATSGAGSTISNMEWNLVDTVIGNSDSITIPEDVFTYNEQVEVLALVVLTQGTTDVTICGSFLIPNNNDIWMMNGYVTSSTDWGLVDFNLSDHGKTIELNNCYYAATQHNTDATVNIYYRTEEPIIFDDTIAAWTEILGGDPSLSSSVNSLALTGSTWEEVDDPTLPTNFTLESNNLQYKTSTDRNTVVLTGNINISLAAVSITDTTANIPLGFNVSRVPSENIIIPIGIDGDSSLITGGLKISTTGAVSLFITVIDNSSIGADLNLSFSGSFFPMV